MPSDAFIQHVPLIKWNLHCSMYTAAKQQMELEICVHDTRFHPREDEEKDWNETRSSRRLHTKCHTIVSVALSNRERKRESQSMFPICVTLCVPGYWLVWRASSLAPAHVRHESAGVLLVPPFIYSSFYLNPLSLSHSAYYVLLPLCLHTSMPRLFMTILSTVSCTLLSLHLFPSIFFYPGLTVWKVDVLVCKSQSDVWVKYG